MMTFAGQPDTARGLAEPDVERTALAATTPAG
jgi:hypothetical protein